jgi:subtilisin family serine protease
MRRSSPPGHRPSPTAATVGGVAIAVWLLVAAGPVAALGRTDAAVVGAGVVPSLVAVEPMLPSPVRDGSLAPSDVVVGSDARQRVLVTLDEQRDPYALARLSATASVPADVHRFVTVDAVALDVSAGQLDTLRRQPGVVAVHEDRVLRTDAELSTTTAEVGAPSAWAGGASGQGQVVVIIDTGVDSTHPMLAGKVVDEACYTATLPGTSHDGSCPDGSDTQVGAGSGRPCAVIPRNCYHGTHVASIAAGNGDGRRGVAPDASIAAIQVFSPTGAGDYVTSESAVVRALDHVAQLSTTMRIASVNLSLGGNPAPTPCDASPTPLIQAAVALRARGIPIVAAAGNVGQTGTVAYPACSSALVSVASVGSGPRYSSFSNRSAVQQLAAPGEDVVAAYPGGGYQSVSGTSQATPHVAGAFAVLRSQRPTLGIDPAVALLRRTGDPVFDPSLGTVTRAALVRLDRATDPQYQSDDPATPSVPASPVGALDLLQPAVAGLRVAGWAFDADSVVPSVVHVYVDGVFTTSWVASGKRADIAALYPGYGAAHGFDRVVAVAPGGHDVCVFALDQGPFVAPSRLGCQRATVGAPFGALDTVTVSTRGLTVGGWAVDPSTPGPSQVHVYVDGVLRVATAAPIDRPDVAAAFPAMGPAHGFSSTVSQPAGPHTVCVYAISATGVAPNPLLGCRSVVVPPGTPFGVIDAAVRTSPSTISVQGWALDPDAPTPIAVHVYVDGTLRAGVLASLDRPDVAAGIPDHGAAHGFDVRVPAPAGTLHEVCVFAIDSSGNGDNPSLGCRTL